MATTIGIPVVSASIKTGDVTTVVAVGDNVTVTTPGGMGNVDVTTTGDVLGIELMNKPFAGKRDSVIYDGVPTSKYENPVCALIKNAADVFDVNAMVIEVPGATEADPKTHVRVNISDIKTVTVTAPPAG